MGRIRTVKPALFKHEDLFDAEQETGLPLRLAFIGLFTVADKEGRFAWQPRTLKTDVLPHDDIDFSRVLDALATRGFVRKYRVGGRAYGVVVTFKNHQVINNREADSFLPSPDEDEGVEPTLTRDARVPDATVTPLVQTSVEGEGKGREKEGKEEVSSAEPTPTPADDLELPAACDRGDGAQAFHRAVDEWNALAVEFDLPAVKTRDDARRRQWLARFGGEAERWLAALAAVRASKFCQGTNDRGWRADFNFLLQPKSLNRLLEGGYADRGGGAQDSTGVDWEALRARDHAA